MSSYEHYIQRSDKEGDKVPSTLEVRSDRIDLAYDIIPMKSIVTLNRSGWNERYGYCSVNLQLVNQDYRTFHFPSEERANAFWKEVVDFVCKIKPA